MGAHTKAWKRHLLCIIFTRRSHIIATWLLFLCALIDAGNARNVLWRPGDRKKWGIGELAEVVHSRRQLQAVATYCVAATGADQTQLQAALDWACGPGNVDCSQLQQGGLCFNPDTLAAHASYAFNAYYVRMAGATGSCFFNGVATTTSVNPSSASCIYPALYGSLSTPSTTPAAPTTATTTTPTTTSPVVTSPTTTTTTTPSTSNSTIFSPPYFDTNTTFSPPTTGTTSSAINTSLPWMPYGLCGLIVSMILLS